MSRYPENTIGTTQANPVDAERTASAPIIGDSARQVDLGKRSPESASTPETHGCPTVSANQPSGSASPHQGTIRSAVNNGHFLINDVTARTSLSRSTILRYESEGKIKNKSGRLPNGRRTYSEEMVCEIMDVASKIHGTAQPKPIITVEDDMTVKVTACYHESSDDVDDPCKEIVVLPVNVTSVLDSKSEENTCVKSSKKASPRKSKTPKKGINKISDSNMLDDSDC